MKNLLTGILIGCGAILPGISSGVFCVIFGMYEKIINSVLFFFKDIKKNTKFLLPIILGTLIGVLLFSNILKLAFTHFYIPTSFAFMGLILGTLPIIIKQSLATENPTLTHIMCLILALSFSIYLSFLEGIRAVQMHLLHLIFGYLVLVRFHHVCRHSNTRC